MLLFESFFLLILFLRGIQFALEDRDTETDLKDFEKVSRKTLRSPPPPGPQEPETVDIDELR